MFASRSRKRGDHVGELLEREVAEFGDFVDPLVRRMRVQRDRALGDVRGEIADALELDADAQRAEHLAQVARDRLAQGEHADRARVEFALEFVDFEVLAHHARGDRGVAQQQRVDRAGELRLRQLAHARDRAC